MTAKSMYNNYRAYDMIFQYIVIGIITLFDISQIVYERSANSAWTFIWCP